MADSNTLWGGQWIKLYDGGDSAYRFGVVEDYKGGTTSDYGVAGSSVYSVDATGTVAVTDAPLTGCKLVIDAIHLSCNPLQTITFEEETSKARIMKVIMPANTSQSFYFPSKVKLSTAAKKLNVVSSAAGTVECLVCYHSEA